MSSAPQPRPPRILVLFWGRRGGGSLFTRYFAEHIRATVEGAQVTVSLRDDNLDRPLFAAAGFSVLPVDIGSIGSLLARPDRLWKIVRAHLSAVLQLAPDMVLITMNSPLCWPIAGLIKRHGIPLVYVAHDPEPHPGDYARTLQRITHASLMRWADRIVALSGYVGERLRTRLGGRSPALRVVPLETVIPSRRRAGVAAPAEGEAVRLLFLGRLLPYKGLEQLPDVLAALRDRSDWFLTVVGQGPLEPAVRRAFEGWPQVRLALGWQTDEAIEAYLSTHHLLLCPYVEASQSGVVGLALAWGLPCLVTPNGALPEQIGHGSAGIVAAAPTPAAFRDALVGLLDDVASLDDLSRGAAELMRVRQADQGWASLVRECLAIRGRR